MKHFKPIYNKTTDKADFYPYSILYLLYEKVSPRDPNCHANKWLICKYQFYLAEYHNFDQLLGKGD